MGGEVIDVEEVATGLPLRGEEAGIVNKENRCSPALAGDGASFGADCFPFDFDSRFPSPVLGAELEASSPSSSG